MISSPSERPPRPASCRAGGVILLQLIAAIAASPFFGNCCAAGSETFQPAGIMLRDEGGLKSADRFFEKITAVPAGSTASVTEMRSGQHGMRITLKWQNGSSEGLAITPFDHGPGLKEAGLELTPGRVRNYVRPNVSRYIEKIQADYAGKWDDLPSLFAYRFPLEFRRESYGASIWWGGRYAGRMDNPGWLKEIVFEIPPGSAVGGTAFNYGGYDSRYLPIDIACLPAASSLPSCTVVNLDGGGVSGQAEEILFASGGRTVPFNAKKTALLDIGRTYIELEEDCRGLPGRCVRILARSSFDGLKDSVVVTVPGEQYIRAWLLCIVDDVPEKEPVVTARLTRFVEGSFMGRSRDAIADAAVNLPRAGEEPVAGVERAGAVTINGETLPLWLVEVPLAVGEIQDLLWQEDPVRGTLRIGSYLDFELLGRLRESAGPTTDYRWKPDGSVSGVRVLGVTLEKTPVELEVRQSRPGNIFHNAEKPEIPIALRPKKDGEYTVRWEIRDVDGNKSAGERRFKLRAGDEELETVIHVGQPELGWYGIDIELWEGTRRLLKYPAAFALLGPDTRQAGFESPYGAWWFGAHHYGTSDEAIAGELLNKLGIRRVYINHGADRRRLSEDILSPWKLTDPMFPCVVRMKRRGSSDDEIEARIRDHLSRFPSAGYIMIFHESHPRPYNQAPELVGLAPADEHEGAAERYEQALWAGKFIRERFPGLKIVIGNSLGSSELIAELLRRGFPGEYADYIGSETTGRTGLPEKMWASGTQAFWLLREIARIYGYNWQVATCFEYHSRHDRVLGQKRQAEWYVRDALIAHAYRAPYIRVGAGYDVGNSYQNSMYGGGVCRRYPLLFPKKSYVAISVLTRMLDRARLRGEFPTGSNSIYALEFDRPDGERVYAVWTSRGTAELNIEFAQDTAVEVVDMYGRSRKSSAGQRGLALTAGTSVKYLVTPAAARKITCLRRYCEYELYDLPPDDFRVVNAMDDPGEWELAEGVDALLERSDPHRPEIHRTAGNYIMRGVKDEEKGDCLEIELVPNKALPALVSEYAVLRLKNPVKVSGEPNTMGIWVKGNSGWGLVYWEVEDARGRRKITCGTTMYGDTHDYKGRVSINFDGWHFLSFPVAHASPIPNLSCGSAVHVWHPAGIPSYPIKVTGIAVSLPPRALYLSEMNRVRQVLRFRDLSVYE